MICRIEFSHLKIKSISSSRWPQLGPGLIVGTSHRSARIGNIYYGNIMAGNIVLV